MDEPCPKNDLAENSKPEIAGLASRQQAETANPTIPTNSKAAPNMAGLASRGQRAEMRVLLAGKWPALKPLPVFKYETGEYRAAIEFDKLRGEWACRKISFPSNKIQEMRGGLAEITLALPGGGAGMSAEDGDMDHLEQEAERDAVRRAQVMKEWREKSESGTGYSELEGYLSRGQQEEVYESIRLTLTARQLQVLPKNVAYVFEALSKAGGRLATLVEMAHRRRDGQGAELEEPAKGFAPEPARVFAAAAGEGFLAPPSGNFNFGTVEQIAAIGSGLPERMPVRLPEPILEAEPEEAGITRHASARETASEVAEEVAARGHRRGAFGDFGGYPRAERDVPAKVAGGDSRSRLFVLEISGFQVAAFSVVILFAVISLTVGFTLGGGPIAQRLRAAEKSVLGAEATPQGAPSEEETAGGSAESKKTETETSAEEKAESGTKPEAVEKPVAKETNTVSRVGPQTPKNPTESVERKESIAPTGRSTAGRGSRKVVREARNSIGPTVAPRNAESRWEAAKSVASHASGGSAILVRGPGDGSKAFRLTFPEKTIAASSTFAMSAQLSVMVGPEAGLAAAHVPSRLQAGGVVSYVWPHYFKPRDKSGSAETVKVRTTIGKYGEVEDVKLVSGSSTFFAAAMSAIRQWHFKPTLLNERPVQAQEDVTIEYRR